MEEHEGNNATITSGEYSQRMGLDKHSGRLRRIYREIADIRKYEIELYWKRTAYFATLIGAAFAGFYWSFPQTESGIEKCFLSMLIAGLGTILSYAWCLANKGSKYWQEN